MGMNLVCEDCGENYGRISEYLDDYEMKVWFCPSCGKEYAVDEGGISAHSNAVERAYRYMQNFKSTRNTRNAGKVEVITEEPLF